MATRRAQVSIQQDTLFPRDALVMTPHFHIDEGFTWGDVDDQALADDLATGISGWLVSANSRQVTVKIYDALAPPPNFPKAEAVRNVNAAPAAVVPRELAICLSFYATANRPRQRGRLFVPVALMVSAAGALNMTLRPQAAQRLKAADLVPILAGLGGVNVDWVVWSRVDQTARKVTNWWVDDEWDIQRRRGLRPTTRDTGTTSG